jgi:5-methylthioadenosine/S-adenosylhomocysteine deaminase
MTKTTWIKKASFVVAWEEAEGAHVYKRNADVVFAGNDITFVGKDYGGTADETIDGDGLMVMPGLIDVHTHASHTYQNKSALEEVDSLKLYATVLFEYNPILRLAPEYVPDCCRCSLGELLLSGCTTLVDMTAPYDGWFDVLAESGIRGYAAPGYASASFHTPNGHEMCYAWDEEAGRKKFKRALELIDAAERHESGRLKGLFYPAQADTCSEELIRDTVDAARDRGGMPMQTHCSQSVVEFREVMRRTGKTPVGWLNDLGFLGPNALLGHCIFIDDNPRLYWPVHRDRAIIAETGATVAHCPVVQSRRGRVLQSFSSYRKAGINIGLGTDTFPMNMIEEMRGAAIMGKTADGNSQWMSARAAFDAATIGGAQALGRPDLGRLAVGAKADLVLVDVTHPLMLPARDPLKNLIYAAGDKPVRDVYVDGNLVVKNGDLQTFDLKAAAERFTVGHGEMLTHVAERDWANRTADEALPTSLEFRD